MYCSGQLVLVTQVLRQVSVSSYSRYNKARVVVREVTLTSSVYQSLAIVVGHDCDNGNTFNPSQLTVKGVLGGDGCCGWLRTVATLADSHGVTLG